MVDSDQDYHQYLLGISRFGLFYRDKFLYPKVTRILGSSTVVDVGCGIGGFLSYLNDSSSYGIDSNFHNVNYIKSLGLNCVQASCDGNFPIESSQFEALFCDQVLEHVSVPHLFLSESRRILKPGASAIFGVPCLKGYSQDKDHKIFYDLNTLHMTLLPHFFLNTFFYSPINSKRLGHFFGFQSLYVACTAI